MSGNKIGQVVVIVMLAAVSLASMGVTGAAKAADGGGVAGGADGLAAKGWLSWRGPEQSGVSRETKLPEKWELGGVNDLWKVELAGRGTPVVDGDRVYAWGYRGDGAELQEVLACIEAATGKVIWEHTYSDFLSDVVYDRYTIGSPTVDPETGHVHLLTTPGIAYCYDRDGKELWHRSLAEEFGRLTFPNGRTGAPAIDGDLVIYHSVTANWGAEGPPRDRFYAFDKRTGQPVWSSTPGLGPPYLKDNSFSLPVFETLADGRRVFYAGLGCGNVVCVNARTGQPIWRRQFSIGGVNATHVLYKDTVISLHGVENVDDSGTGGMISLKRHAAPTKAEDGTMVLGDEAVVWRNKLCQFSSSPIIVDDVVYMVDITGVLHAVDAGTGAVKWHKKLGPDQIHASPLYADGKLYIPVNNGTFYILKPHADGTGAEELAKVKLAGNCLGAPAVYNGRVFVFTTEALYAFGSATGNDKANLANLPSPPAAAADDAGKPGAPVALQVIPSEVLLKPGESIEVKARGIDGVGRSVGSVPVTFEKFFPPTAKVKSEMDAAFSGDGTLAAKADAKPSAGAFKATATGGVEGKPLTGIMRGRVLATLPFAEDFERYELGEKAKDQTPFAHPPLEWIGARFKWEVREKDGSKVLTKTLDQLILQRAITFIGPEDLSNYTISADVMTDGNRRLMSEVGVINQRYIISLKGSHDQIEVSSNHERIKVAAPMTLKPGTWYRLTTRVDVNADGSGVVRGKAWPRGEAEPANWSIEVPVPFVHKQGAPGLFGFAPSNRFAVYVDNVTIQPSAPLTTPTAQATEN
jgi:outer membrane protein assembly factor BamB